MSSGSVGVVRPVLRASSLVPSGGTGDWPGWPCIACAAIVSWSVSSVSAVAPSHVESFRVVAVVVIPIAVVGAFVPFSSVVSAF